MMIMTLCLLVYNVGQNQLRQALEQNNESLPDQKRKPNKKPTLRWVFRLMKNINIAHYPGQPSATIGLNDNKRKIISLFGGATVRIYGI